MGHITLDIIVISRDMPTLTIAPLTLDTERPTVYSFDFICPEDLPISTWLPDFTIQTSSFLIEFAT